MADAFPVSGAIDAKTFPYLIMDLHRGNATGSLKVDGPSYQKALYFRGGRVLFGSSNDPRDQLGAILIDAGKLNPEQLEEMTAKVGPGHPLAKVLADSGLVTQQELSEAARLKVERILRDILSYAEGSFDFEDGVLPKGAIDLKLNTHRLVLGAVQKIADRSFVLGHLGSLQTVLEATGDATSVADVRAEVGPLFDLIDGHRSLKDAIGRTSFEEFEAAKIACALLFLGAARPVKGGTAPAAPEGDAPFFMASSSPGLDLGDTARLAFAEPEPEPEPEEQATVIAPSVPEPSLEFAVDDEPPQQAEAPIAVPEPETPVGFALAADPDEIEVTAAEISPEAEAPTLSARPEGEIPTLRMPTAPSSPSTSHSSLPLIPPPPRAPQAKSMPLSIPPIEDAPSPLGQPPETGGGPAIRPPSKDDLAALDAILNPQGLSEPAARLEPAAVPTTYHALQRFGPQGVARQSSSRGLLILLVLLILVGGVGAVWWFFLRSPHETRSVTESPLVPLSETPPAVIGAAQPSPSSTDVIGATPAPGPTTAPTPLAALPTPLATAPPLQPTPTATPRPQPPPAGTNGPALLAAGQYTQAADSFVARARTLPAGTMAIQILVACSSDTVAKAVATVGSDQLILLPVDFHGRSCFRLCWGTYDSSTSASAALATVPVYFRQGGARPTVVPLSSVLP
jgi:hypothetical protein